jgi:hypothetical protein
MSIHQKFRGGAPVGQMDELPLLEMSLIVYFRMMASSLETRQALKKDFLLAFGEDHGLYYSDKFEELYIKLTTQSRRKIMHHELNCKYFGGDESVVANMITLAAMGNVKDAELLAFNLVSGNLVKEIVSYSKEIGSGLRLMLDRFPIPVISSHNPRAMTH